MGLHIFLFSPHKASHGFVIQLQVLQTSWVGFPLGQSFPVLVSQSYLSYPCSVFWGKLSTLLYLGYFPYNLKAKFWCQSYVIACCSRGSGTGRGSHAGAPGKAVRLLPDVERGGPAGAGGSAPAGALAAVSGNAGLGPAASIRDRRHHV